MIKYYKEEIKKYKKWNKNNTDKSFAHTIWCLKKLIEKIGGKA